MYIIVDRVYRYIVCHIWTTSSTFSYQCLSSCLVSNQPFLRDTTGWVSWKVLRVNEKHLKVYQIYSLRLLNIDKQTKMIRLEWIKWKILEYIYIYVYIYTRYSLKYILRQMDWMLWQRIYQTSESSWSTNQLFSEFSNCGKCQVHLNVFLCGHYPWRPKTHWSTSSLNACVERGDSSKKLLDTDNYIRK